ncbi:hypothetical protein ACFE04_019832 [Oxalis oulophora]
MRFIDTHPPARRGTNNVRARLGVGWVEAACCLATLRERAPHNMTYIVPPPLLRLAAGFEPTTIRLAGQTQHHDATMTTYCKNLARLHPSAWAPSISTVPRVCGEGKCQHRRHDRCSSGRMGKQSVGARLTSSSMGEKYNRFHRIIGRTPYEALFGHPPPTRMGW